MEHLIKPLKDLGLSEKEVSVYLALLQLGSATPYQIAKKSGIKRPTAYVIAEELIKKGLVIHIPGEEKKRYIAKKPDAFLEEQEEKLAQAWKILPELNSYQKNVAEKPSILYFEGINGLHQAYAYRQKELHNKEVVGFFASNENASTEVTQFFVEWNEYRIKHNIPVRGITVDSPDLLPFAKFFEEGVKIMSLKFLPRNMYSSKISIESCNNQFVRIFLFDSVETLIIESPKFAVAIKEIFELVWKSMEGKFNKPTTWTK